jgi:tRNA pseudouridine55 synthase
MERRMPDDTQRGGRLPGINGVLNINKPDGMTSMDVVRHIKRASRQKRVGHGGTLDPFAVGVIPVCLGQATRMMEYLIDGTRVYRAVVELGVETDTYDIEGAVTYRGDASGITLEDIQAALDGFKGDIKQVPPMYSALKQNGKRLYELARAGIEVEREARDVEVHDIVIRDWSSPTFEIDVQCGRGFYVRSLAYDLGQILGCGGHLKSLARLRAGTFAIEEAVDLSEAERLFYEGGWEAMVSPLDSVVAHMKAAIVGQKIEDMIRNGRSLPSGLRIPLAQPGEQCRLYAVDGSFVAIMSFDPSAGRWKPDRVFNSDKNAA